MTAAIANPAGTIAHQAPEEIAVRDEWLGPGYGIPTPEAMDAIRIAAETQGYLLDPVYTGKAFSGLVGEVRAEFELEAL